MYFFLPFLQSRTAFMTFSLLFWKTMAVLFRKEFAPTYIQKRGKNTKTVELLSLKVYLSILMQSSTYKILNGKQYRSCGGITLLAKILSVQLL